MIHPAQSPSPVPASIPADNLREPGSYLCLWSGHLLRLPKEPIHPSCFPLVMIEGSGSLLVVRLSSDPHLSANDAREMALELGLFPDF
jgi:hypothetical protein